MKTAARHKAERLGGDVLVGRSEKVVVFGHIEYLASVVNGVVYIVRDHYHRNSAVVELVNHLIHLGGHYRVETGDRLVEEQEFLRRAQCSCKQNALLLTAGEITVALICNAFYLHTFYLTFCTGFVFLRIEREKRVAVKAAG